MIKEGTIGPILIHGPTIIPAAGILWKPLAEYVGRHNTRGDQYRAEDQFRRPEGTRPT
ncbi:MAG: hypothetical protein LZF60_340094 [Nitrospira sp.]|nr:MAG: hypothetical protein LZF60_340094 [Nitrospira sp.]